MSYTIKGMDKFLKLSERIPKEPEAWTCDDVSEWLRLIEMEQYVDNFRSMSIDGWLIFEIEEVDLTEDLNVNTKLHRRKIMKGITMLKEYKQYIRNGHAKTNILEGAEELLIEEQPPVKMESTPLREETHIDMNSHQIEEEKADVLPPQHLDAQTRHQDMNPKFAFDPSYGNNNIINTFE